MEVEAKRLRTSDQIKQNMKDQGRTFTWLMKELGISRRTFYSKLNDNVWHVGDIIKMKELGVL